MTLYDELSKKHLPKLPGAHTAEIKDAVNQAMIALGFTSHHWGEAPLAARPPQGELPCSLGVTTSSDGTRYTYQAWFVIGAKTFSFTAKFTVVGDDVSLVDDTGKIPLSDKTAIASAVERAIRSVADKR